MELFNQFLNFVRPSEHSKFSPSSAERWLITGCPASLRLSEGIPSERSVYADEGTLAHKYCECLIREKFYCLPVPNDVYLEVMQLPDQGAELMGCAERYVDVISYWLQSPEIGKVIWWGLEKGVPVFPEKGCFGTADCIIIGDKGSAVIDFKYGKGKKVSGDSPQLKVYAAGLAKHLPVNHDYKVHVVIHQPRIAEDTQNFSYSHRELMEFCDVIYKSILACEDPNAPIVDGNHCFWCPARRTKDVNLKCPVQLEKPIKLANEKFDQFLSDSAIVPAGNVDLKARRDAALIKLMAIFPVIESYVKEAKEEMMSRVEAGEMIEGVMIERVEGRREISGANLDEKAAIIRQSFPHIEPTVAVPATVKLKTLAQLEKELGKEKAKLNLICTKPIKKELKVLDDKTREILSSMSQYANQIGGL